MDYELKRATISVNRDSIQTFAKSLVSESYPDFVTSDGWLKRFMREILQPAEAHMAFAEVAC